MEYRVYKTKIINYVQGIEKYQHTAHSANKTETAYRKKEHNNKLNSQKRIYSFTFQKGRN